MSSEDATPRTEAAQKEGRKRRLIVCLDSGDTLVDEGTEVKENKTVMHADLIPGAAEMVRTLYDEGYMLILVADGRRRSFRNVLHTQHDIWKYFSGFALSDDVGDCKPDRKMFEKAMEESGVGVGDAKRMVMVGNNLARDILGANEMGMITVWLDWAPRRSKVPASPLEKPDYTIRNPSELPSLIAELEQSLTEL